MKINEKLKAQIIKVILSRKPVDKILLYGSRARGDFKAASDVDLAIVAPRWTHRDASLVHNQLEETISTPLKFDLVLFHELDKTALKERIIKEGAVLYESTTR